MRCGGRRGDQKQRRDTRPALSGESYEQDHFYKTRDDFASFPTSCFSDSIDGKLWLTTEHYFQAQKFSDQSYQERIRLEPSPMIAARLGRSREVPIRAIGNSERRIMRRAVSEKIKQHERLRLYWCRPVMLNSSSTRPMTVTGATVGTVPARTCLEDPDGDSDKAKRRNIMTGLKTVPQGERAMVWNVGGTRSLYRRTRRLFLFRSRAEMMRRFARSRSNTWR